MAKTGFGRTARLSAILTPTLIVALAGVAPVAAEEFEIQITLDCDGQVPTINRPSSANTDGTAVFHGTKGNDVILGTDGLDQTAGFDGNDVICDAGGDDEIYGLGGDDLIYGDARADVVCVGMGADRLLGDAHADAILGGPGNDDLTRHLGDDKLRDVSGLNRMIGGFGLDAYSKFSDLISCELMLVSAPGMPISPPKETLYRSVR
jgi:hypothetical protein